MGDLIAEDSSVRNLSDFSVLKSLAWYSKPFTNLFTILPQTLNDSLLHLGLSMHFSLRLQFTVAGWSPVFPMGTSSDHLY